MEDVTRVNKSDRKLGMGGRSPDGTSSTVSAWGLAARCWLRRRACSRTQIPVPQPYLVPVSSRVSRTTHSCGRDVNFAFTSVDAQRDFGHENLSRRQSGWSINAWQRRPNLRNPMVKEFKRKAEIAAVNRRGTDYRAIDGVRTSHARAAGLACNYNSAT